MLYLPSETSLAALRNLCRQLYMCLYFLCVVFRLELCISPLESTLKMQCDEFSKTSIKR